MVVKPKIETVWGFDLRGFCDYIVGHNQAVED